MQCSGEGGESQGSLIILDFGFRILDFKAPPFSREAQPSAVAFDRKGFGIRDSGNHAASRAFLPVATGPEYGSAGDKPIRMARHLVACATQPPCRDGWATRLHCRAPECGSVGVWETRKI